MTATDRNQRIGGRMRITCPNCGAQYEVPAEVVPQDGRDVQCSNCGVTWFQAHPDHAAPEAPEMDEAAGEAPAGEAPAGEAPFGEADAPRSEPIPEQVPGAASQRRQRPGRPAAAGVDADGSPKRDPGDADAGPDPAREMPPAAVEPQDPAGDRRELAPEIADILREEAAHEARLRDSDPLESQPDLGLDEPGTGAAAARARGRAALRRSETLEDPVGTRRDLLPDIEEINSTLRSDNGRAMSRRAELDEEEYEAPRRRSGFSRGFATMMIIAVLLVLLYANAPMLSQKIPALDAFLNGLVHAVDRARLWLDAKVQGFSG